MIFQFSLLSPIGDHRSKDVKRSRGKRAKKRRRDEVCNGTISDTRSRKPHETEASSEPEVLNYLTIGFNATTRSLEALAQHTCPKTPPSATSSLDTEAHKLCKVQSAEIQDSLTHKPLIAVFVPRSDQPSIMYSHLPMLVNAASLPSSLSSNIKLVALLKGAESKLSAALGVPRVGIIGLIEGAPASSLLVEFIRQHVRQIEAPWFTEAESGVCLPVEINVT